MNKEATALWERAQEAIQAAYTLLPVSPDRVASTAYYAAFYAVSALFVLEGKTFIRHSAIEASIHRDLVKEGRLSIEIGSFFSELNSIRHTGDYGVLEHITTEDAERSIEMAKAIIDAVKNANPQFGDLTAQENN